jgi:hypothetical protein
MKKNVLLTVIFMFIGAFSFQTASAQFTIKIPKIKVEKPKPETSKTDDGNNTPTSKRRRKSSPPLSRNSTKQAAEMLRRRTTTLENLCS